MPESLEALDPLLVMVVQSRLVRRDGIRFQGLRYTDPTLAAYVGKNVAIRYDPRDIIEIRVFHHNRFLCRAVSAEHAHRTIYLKDIQQARVARRRALRDEIAVRTRMLIEFLPYSPSSAPVNKPKHEQPSQPSSPRLVLYEEDKKP